MFDTPVNPSEGKLIMLTQHCVIYADGSLQLWIAKSSASNYSVFWLACPLFQCQITESTKTHWKTSNWQGNLLLQKTVSFVLLRVGIVRIVHCIWIEGQELISLVWARKLRESFCILSTMAKFGYQENPFEQMKGITRFSGPSAFGAYMYYFGCKISAGIITIRSIYICYSRGFQRKL